MYIDSRVRAARRSKAHTKQSKNRLVGRPPASARSVAALSSALPAPSSIAAVVVVLAGRRRWTANRLRLSQSGGGGRRPRPRPRPRRRARARRQRASAERGGTVTSVQTPRESVLLRQRQRGDVSVHRHAYPHTRWRAHTRIHTLLAMAGRTHRHRRLPARIASAFIGRRRRRRRRRRPLATIAIVHTQPPGNHFANFPPPSPSRHDPPHCAIHFSATADNGLDAPRKCATDNRAACLC